MGGRIDDIAVVGKRPEHHLSRLRRRRRLEVGEQRRRRSSRCSTPTASASIGDIAIHPTNPDIVYVGTGEAEQPPDVVVRRRHLQDHRRRQDVHAHRPSRDADDRAHRHRSAEPRDGLRRGARATCSGLTRSAASTRRTDGGKTWTKVKFVDENTGFTDLAIDPVEPEHPLRGELPAPPHRLLLQRRRSGQRDLEDRRTPARPGRS